MTDKTDLLPLPEKKRLAVRYERSFGSVTAYGHDDDTLRDYARANVAHATATLQTEIERLRKLLDRMVVCNPDGSVGIRVTEDALNAAAELYRLFGDAKKEAGND